MVNREARPELDRRALVVKFGGELLEEPEGLRVIAAAVRSVSSRSTPCVVVHGGGKEIDASLKRAGIPKHQVDGLRITDDATLDVVVSVVAGSLNTRLVAALTSAGVSAVGLTGADAGCGYCQPAPPFRTQAGTVVDLGRVGVPSEQSDTRILVTLMAHGFVPVLACIGLSANGDLLNVNADTLAGHIAGRLAARRLVIAGTTPGVLGPDGSTIPLLDASGVARLVGDRTATAGMIAKLRACETAVGAGVDDVVIVDGRDRAALESALSDVPGEAPRSATRLVSVVESR